MASKTLSGAKTTFANRVSDHDGLRLGPVGSTIISEVFVGLVNGDRNSFLWQVKNWKPTLASQSTGNFTMTDMLRFVNDINPIGD